MNPTTAELIEKYGQPAFEAALRQVQLATMLNGWLAVGLLAVTALLLFQTWRITRERYWPDSAILCMLSGIFTGIFGFTAFVFWFLMTSNPVYYAIRALIGH